MSRMLLDTHALLWLLTDDDALGPRTRSAISAAEEVLASTASLWELSIKHSIGRFPDPGPIAPAIEAAGLTLLPILPEHALAVRSSPLPHRDPFDRMLLAQSGAHRAILVTADSRILAAGLPDTTDARR